MARRGAQAVAVFLDSLLRVAGTIVLETLAFVVWNVGSRTPFGVLRDARRAFGDRRAFFGGVVSLAIGLVFVAAATVLVFPALAHPDRDFTPLEIATLLVALAIDYLVGDDLRALVRARG
ncbi:MAG: hypothetical protein IAI49_09280 [Candidatus Eremiobacteraeota bacterium]|nr:hypothetical protein [Candidatus Eremiobacteraeota bacterium]